MYKFGYNHSEQGLFRFTYLWIILRNLSIPVLPFSLYLLCNPLVSWTVFWGPICRAAATRARSVPLECTSVWSRAELPRTQQPLLSTEWYASGQREQLSISDSWMRPRSVVGRHSSFSLRTRGRGSSCIVCERTPAHLGYLHTTWRWTRDMGSWRRRLVTPNCTYTSGREQSRSLHSLIQASNIPESSDICVRTRWSWGSEVALSVIFLTLSKWRVQGNAR